MMRACDGLRVLGGCVVVVSVLAGCETLLTEPAPSRSPVTVSFQIDGAPAGGVADAFAKVRSVGVRFTRPDGATRDTAFLVRPVDGTIRIPVALEVQERVDALAIEAFLAFQGGVLFQGATTVAIEPGVPTSARVPLTPVPAGITTDRAVLSIPNIGDIVELSSSVLFASLDSIPGAERVWLSEDPSIVSVTPDGQASAVSAGQTRLVVQHGVFTDTLPARLALVDTVVVAPDPLPPVAVGESLQLVAALRDADGNELLGRPVAWASVDPDVASVDDTGLLVGLAPGTTEIVVGSGNAVTRLPLEVVPAATMSLVPRPGG